MKYYLPLLILLSLSYASSAQTQPTINQQLLTLFTADQMERKQGRMDRNKDAERLKITKQLLADGQLRHAKDFYHAAFIFQHGSEPENYKTANELALKAVAIDPNFKGAKWLACAAEDRYLHSIGQPQIWGTQFIITDHWSMEPFDENAKTDEERKAHGVPTLAEIKAYLKQKNTSP